VACVLEGWIAEEPATALLYLIWRDNHKQHHLTFWRIS